jgi:hypothetical protein
MNLQSKINNEMYRFQEDCENYLSEDYHWKSGILIWNRDLMSTGKKCSGRRSLVWVE